MPVVNGSSYRKPSLLFNKHLETILPSGIRRFESFPSKTSFKISTPDDDFLRIDEYCKKEHTQAVIISHGFEGDSERPYVKGMIKRLYEAGFDVFAWNFRGCGGEMNNAQILYHSGATYDLDTVVQSVLLRDYTDISLVGFSLGGNLTLKYLGEYKVPSRLKSAVAFSVPLHLSSCCKVIDSPQNIFYAQRFIRSLKPKIIKKREQFPDLFTHLPTNINFSTLYQFDDWVTAPLHGFDNPEHYYRECSSINYIDKINIPTLVINAESDPFLSKKCYDPSYFQSSEHVYFEMPKFGGHVGFSGYSKNNTYWSEERALRFITLPSKQDL